MTGARNVLVMVLAVAAALCTGAANGEAPATFDCEMRKLAVEYAFKIQPFRGKDSFQALVDTLNLAGGQPGGRAQCFNATVPEGLPERFSPKFSIPDAQVSFYVDPNAGDDDANDGSAGRPFSTVGRAVRATREARLGGSQATAGTSFGVVLKAGVHYVSETIELSARDSNLTFQSVAGEQVWLSGARLARHEASGPPNWEKHPEKENVWVLDLSSAANVREVTGLRIGRRRAVRARYPNGCTSDKELPSGYRCVGEAPEGGVVDPSAGFGSNLLSEWVDAIQPTMHQDNWQEYDVSAAPTRPIGASYQKFSLGIGGTCKGFDPPAGYWCSTHCFGGAPKPPNCLVRYPRGVLTKDLPNAPYRRPGTAVVQAWRPGHWASWMFEVDADKSNGTHLMFSKGGFQGGRGSNSGEAFFVENVEEELDAENEFFFDEDLRRLQYFSRSGPPKGAVEIPTLRTLFKLSGTQEEPVSNVHWLGLGIRDTRLTYMDNHTMPSGGDWGLNLRAAIEMRGVDRVSVNSCTFEELDGNAMIIKGFARRVMIQNNDFHVLGGNIIAQLGETEAPGLPKEWGLGWNGTAGNQPRGTIVRNNFAHRCGLFAKQSSFYFQAKSMGNLIQNNIFFHGPRAGINFNDGFGGGSVVEGNLMFATVMETGDHGPFNSWDRQPYAHRFDESGAFVMAKEVDQIRGNFLVGNYYAQEVIDNDDGSSRYETHHNFLVYGEVGLKSDFDGHSNVHHNNLYAYLNGHAFNTGKYRVGEEDRFYNNTVVLGSAQMSYASYDCGCKPGGASNSCPYFAYNRILTPSGATPNVCGSSFDDRVRAGIDKGSTLEKWPTPTAVIALARGLLGLSSAADRPRADPLLAET